MNKIISRAIDWETIVSLHKKSESNSIIAKVLQIRRETVWKVVKKFRKTGLTSNRPGKAEREQFEPSEWLKTRGKIWGQIPVVRRWNWPQRLESARLQCAASLRKTSRSSPTRCRSAMSSHPRMNEWVSKDGDTFWTSWKIHAAYTRRSSKMRCFRFTI